MTAATLDGVRHVLHATRADETTPGFARGWLAGVLTEQHVPAEVVDDALLVGSELVTNSVIHVGGDVFLAALVLEGGSVELRVHDTGAPFGPAETGPDAEHGRGLVIAEALARITYDICDGSTEIRALIPKEAAL